MGTSSSRVIPTSNPEENQLRRQTTKRGPRRRNSLMALGETLLETFQHKEKKKSVRSISLGTELKFVELARNKERRKAIERMLAVNFESEKTKKGLDSVTSKDTTKIQAAQQKLLRSMLPDIVSDTFGDKAVNEPLHFRRNAVLVLFDIKGFSSYAAELDDQLRSAEDKVEAIKKQIEQELVDIGRLQQKWRDRTDSEETTSLLNAEFRKQADHAGEQLQHCLNRTLHEILIQTSKYGLDVIKFAGDAVLCAIWCEEDEHDSKTSQSILNVLRVCKRIEKHLENSVGTLKLHTGISCGTVLCINTGASISSKEQSSGMPGYSRFEFFVVGAPVVEAGRALDHASKPGDVCLCSKTHKILVENAWLTNVVTAIEFDPVEENNAPLSRAPKVYYRLARLTMEQNMIATLERLCRVKVARESFWKSQASTTASGLLGVQPEQDLKKTLRNLSSYIPGYARYFVSGVTSSKQVGHAAMAAFGSRRVMSIVFVHIPWLDSFDADNAEADADRYLADCNDIMFSLLELVSEYEMGLRQLLVDDKGCVAILVVGAPPLSHDDNATRACFAACSLQIAHQNKLSIGIATGKTYMGLIGNSDRHEFAVVGDIVNIAARLMSLAEIGKCVCDSATRTSASTSSLLFVSREEGVLLKGQKSKIKVYDVNYTPGQSWSNTKQFMERTMHQRALLGYVSDNSGFGTPGLAPDKKPFMGIKETETIQENGAFQPRINPSFSQGSSNKAAGYVISGEQGVGKTSLIEWAISANQEVWKKRFFDEQSRMREEDMQNVTDNLERLLEDESKEKQFVAFLDVSPRETKSKFPAWTMLVQKMLAFGQENAGVLECLPDIFETKLMSVNNEKLETSMQAFFKRKQLEEESKRQNLKSRGDAEGVNGKNPREDDAETGVDKRLSSRLGSRLSIRRTASSLILRRDIFALSRVDLLSNVHGIDFGYHSSDASLRESASTPESSQWTSPGHRVRKLKNRNEPEVCLGDRLPFVLEKAMENRLRFNLSHTDFLVLRLLGIMVSGLDPQPKTWRTASMTESDLKSMSLEEVESAIARIVACLAFTLVQLTGKPIIFVFDGAEHFEESSWSVFAQLCDVIEVEGLWDVKVIASCALSECVALQSCESTIYKHNIRWLQLSNLSWNGMDSLICNLFDAKQIDPPISNFLWEQTRGNPKSIIRYVELLVTHRLVHVTEPRSLLCHTGSVSAADLRRSSFPTLASTDLLRRFDRLPRPAQLILQLVTVVSVQSMEICEEDLFMLFQMCCILHLPQFASLHFGKPSMHDNFTSYLSRLVVEHFLVVFRGNQGKVRNQGQLSSVADVESRISQRISRQESSYVSLRSDDSSLLGSFRTTSFQRSNVSNKGSAQAKKQGLARPAVGVAGSYRESMIGAPLQEDRVGVMGNAKLDASCKRNPTYFFSADPGFFRSLEEPKEKIREFYALYSTRVRETIYTSMSDGRRTTLHKDVCAFFESQLLTLAKVEAIEESYAALAGHCRMSRQPFRCFRYYEMAAQQCWKNEDYLNAIYMLRLAVTACLEFNGLLTGRDRVIEQSLVKEVALRFAKWHILIAKLFLKGGYPYEVAHENVKRARDMLKEMVRLESLKKSYPLRIFLVGAFSSFCNSKENELNLSPEAEICELDKLTPLMLEEPSPFVDEGRSAVPYMNPLRELSSRLGSSFRLMQQSFSHSINKPSASGGRDGARKLSKSKSSWLSSAAGGASEKKNPKVRIQSHLKTLKDLEPVETAIQREMREACALEQRISGILRRMNLHALRLQRKLQLDLDDQRDTCRKDMERFFARSMLENTLESSSYAFAVGAQENSDTGKETDSGRQIRKATLPTLSMLVPTEELLTGIIATGRDQPGGLGERMHGVDEGHVVKPTVQQ